MKNEIIKHILNLFKVKSILTFIVAYVFVYLVKTNAIESATVVAIIMMVFKELFDKDKTNIKQDGEEVKQDDIKISKG